MSHTDAALRTRVVRTGNRAQCWGEQRMLDVLCLLFLSPFHVSSCALRSSSRKASQSHLESRITLAKAPNLSLSNRIF